MLAKRSFTLRALAPVGCGLLTTALLAAGCAAPPSQLGNEQARALSRQTISSQVRAAAPSPASESDSAPTVSNAPEAQSPAAASEATIIARDLKFDISSLTVAEGQPVKITFLNQGSIEHDWQVIGLQARDIKIVSTSPGITQRQLDLMQEKAQLGIPHLVAGSGEQVVMEFTPMVSGTFDTLCTIPGHKEAGMTGKLVVGNPDGSPAEMTSLSTPADHQGHGSTAQPLPPNVARLAQPNVEPPVGQREPRTVQVELESKEVVAWMDEGVAYEYWTFNGTVPGPMIRVRQGDTVELTFRNAPDSKVTHSIDLHAVTGPGGGAKFTQVAPGEWSRFTFKALNPGVYVYHCATAPVPHHISNGMYGLIVVEPPEGLPAVDHEFYVMQGDFYLQGERTEPGLRQFSMEKMLDERPDYVVFNGSVGALTGDNALKAEVGDTVRIYFGVGGPNLTSSFHVIGEVFDRVSAEGASEWQTNVQTTMVPAGGATIVEFTVDYPGEYILVDHSLTRLQKGGAAILRVDGEADDAIFKVEHAPAGSAAMSGH